MRLLVPMNWTAVEGQDITLQCYGDTRLDAINVQWKKDGKTLLMYESSKELDEASAGRFSLSGQSFKQGDLSLRIKTVHRSDSGLYLCLIHDESRDGDPRAILLKVESEFVL